MFTFVWFKQVVDGGELRPKSERSQAPEPQIKDEIPVYIDLDAYPEPLNGSGTTSNPFIIE